MKLPRLLAVTILLAAPFSGCTCPSSDTDCAPDITLTSHTDGQVVPRAADEDPNRVGLQVTVVAEAASCMADLSQAAVMVNDDANTAKTAFLIDGQPLTFEGLTLPPRDAEGAVKISVSIEDAETGRRAKDEIVVRLESAPALDCQFVRPPASDLELGDADDALPDTAGFQYDVAVQCAEDLTGTVANLSVDGVAVPSAVFDGSIATFPQVFLNEGLNVLEGRVAVDEERRWSDRVDVMVDTQDCGVRLEPAGDLAFNLTGDDARLDVTRTLADADGDAANGIQADLGATTIECAGGEAVLFLDGAEVARTPVEGTSVSFGRLDLPEGAAMEARVEVQSDGGPSGASVPYRWWVDSVAPSPVVLFPAEGALLRAGDDLDGDATNGVQTELYLEIPELESVPEGGLPEQGAIITATLTSPAWTEPVVTACVVGLDPCVEAGNPNRFRLELELEQIGEYAVEVSVVDPLGNVGAAGPVAFATDARPSFVEITGPEAGAVINAGTEGVVDGSVPVSVSSLNVPEGAEITVTCASADEPGVGVLQADGTASVPVPFAAAPCEGVDVSCTAVARWEGAEVSSDPVDFRVDVAAPEVTIVAPDDGATSFLPDLTVEVVTHCVEDGQDVVVASGGQSVTGAVSADAATAQLTFANGVHEITASVADAAGNAAVSAPVTVQVDIDAPVVVLVAPADQAVLGAPDDVDSAATGFQYDVVVEVASEPAGALVELLVGSSTTPIGPIATGADLRAVFPAVRFPEGTFEVKARATAASGLQSAWTVSSVSVDTGAPTCDILEPVGGTIFGLADDANGDPADGIQHRVRVQSDAGDTQTVELVLVDGAGASHTYTGELTGTGVAFADVPFTAGADGVTGHNALTATCTDALGNAGTSPEVGVDVDLEAPAVVIAAPADGAVFNAAAVDASADPGFQVQVRVTAADPGTGASVALGAAGELTVTCGAAAPVQLPLVFQDYAGAVEARVRPTLVDQSSCVLSAVVTDLAGNVSQPAVSTVRVDRVAPTVSIVRPVAGRMLGQVDDQSSVAGLQRDVEVAYSGLEPGQQVRLFFARTSESGVEVESALSPHAVTSGTSAGYTFAGATVTPLAEDEVSIRVRVVDAAGNEASATVAVSVDMTAPQVQITRPDGTGSCFNLIRDFDQAVPGIQTQVDVGTVGVADGLPLTLCGTGGTGAPCSAGGFFEIAQSQVSGNVAYFQSVSLAEGSSQLMAEVRDLAGNFQASAPVPVCADSIPPDVTAVAVEADTDSDGYLSDAELQTAGGQACFAVSVTGAEGRTLRVTTSNPAAGTSVGTAAVAGGSARVCGSLAEGSHQLTARVTDENGNPNVNAANPTIVDPEAAWSLVKDTAAPALAISSPSASNLNAALDPDPSTRDFELTFAVSSDAEARTVEFLVDGVVVAQATVVGGTAEIQTTLTNGTHDLTARVSDAAGNETTAHRTVQVDTVAPTVAIVAPADGAAMNSNSFSVQVQVAGAQAGRNLKIVRTDGAAEQVVADTTVASTQPQNVAVTLGDGAVTLLARAVDAAGNTGESAPVSLTVDTVGCSLVFVQPVGDPVVFAAGSGTVTGGQLSTDLMVESADCPGTQVTLSQDGVVVGTQATGAADGRATFPVTLADGSSGTFSASIDDGSGNVTEVSFGYSVDVTPPVIARTYPASASLAYVSASNDTVGSTVDGRLRLADKVAGAPAEADFTFEVSGAMGGTLELRLDGAVVHGPTDLTTDPQVVTVSNLQIPQDTAGVLSAVAIDAAGNQVVLDQQVLVDVVAPAVPQLTATLIDERAADVQLSWPLVGDDGSNGTAARIEVRRAAVAIATDADWSAAQVEATPAGGASSATLSGLPPLNTYHLAVRVYDEMDNASELVSGQNTATVVNMWNETVYGGAGGYYGYSLQPFAADLNNDGYDDLVVGSATEPGPLGSQQGAVRIYYGAADPSAVTPQIIRGFSGADLFGLNLTAGDVSGDGIPDLVVSADGYASGQGHAFLFFGVDSQTGASQVDASSPVEFRGSIAGGRFGRAFSVLGDITGTSLPELAIAAAAGTGHAYFYEGRSEADWRAAAAATGYIGTSAGDTALQIAGDPARPDGWFGYFDGWANLGDIGSDGRDDFVVPSAGRLYVFRTDDLGTGLFDATAAFQEEAVSAGLGYQGFHFMPDGQNGYVLATDKDAQKAYLYSVGTGGLSAAPVLTVPKYGAATGFGFSATYGDLNGDGLADLIVGSNGSATNRAYVYYNTGVFPFFETTPATVLEGAGFFGTDTVILDFNGDGQKDVAVGAFNENGGSGNVHLWW